MAVPQLTTHFHIREFKCNDKDGTKVPEKYIPNVQNVADQLQILRDYLEERIIINSGYRTPEYNRKVGGKTASQHLTASAADIVVKSKTPKQLLAIIEKLIKEKKLLFGGVGLYPTFVHVDVRRTKARW